MVISPPLGASIGPRLLGVASLERPQGPRPVVRAGHGGRLRLRHLHELANFLPRGVRARARLKHSDLAIQATQHWERLRALEEPGTAPADGDQPPLGWLAQLLRPDAVGAKPGRQRQDLGDEASAGPAAGRRGAIAQNSEFGCYRHLAARRVVRPQNCQSLLKPRPGIVGAATPKVSHLLRPPAAPDQPGPRDAGRGPLGPRMRKVVCTMGAMRPSRLGLDTVSEAIALRSGRRAVGGCYFGAAPSNGAGTPLHGVSARQSIGTRAWVFM